MLDKKLMQQWLAFKQQQQRIEDELEATLQAQSNLSLNEFYVLYFLNDSPTLSLRLNDLQQYFNLSQSAMSRMIARMENKNFGVIDRHICHEDKRGIYIRLTEKGQQKLAVGAEVVATILSKDFE